MGNTISLSQSTGPHSPAATTTASPATRCSNDVATRSTRARHSGRSVTWTLHRPRHRSGRGGLQRPLAHVALAIVQVGEDRHQVDVAGGARRTARHRPEQQHLLDTPGDQRSSGTLRISPSRRLSRRNNRHETSLRGGGENGGGGGAQVPSAV